MSLLGQFQNVTSSPQYSTFLEHIIPRFLTFLQDGEVQFLQEKPTQVCAPRHSFVYLPAFTSLELVHQSSTTILKVDVLFQGIHFIGKKKKKSFNYIKLFK